MDDLMKKVGEELQKYRIGCNLPRECNSECEKCAAEAVIPLITESVIKTIDAELWKRREMFNYAGRPTRDEKECTLSNLSITSQKWAEVCYDLRGGHR